MKNPAAINNFYDDDVNLNDYMSDDDNYNFNNDIIKEEQTENDTEEHDPYAEILKNIT